MKAEAVSAATLSDYFARYPDAKPLVAKMCGISHAHLINIAAGRRQPGLRLAVKLEALTGVPVVAMLAEKGAA